MVEFATVPAKPVPPRPRNSITVTRERSGESRLIASAIMRAQPPGHMPLVTEKSVSLPSVRALASPYQARVIRAVGCVDASPVDMAVAVTISLVAASSQAKGVFASRWHRKPPGLIGLEYERLITPMPLKDACPPGFVNVF